MIKPGFAAEPPLEDLLSDEILKQMVRSAGLTPSEFREQLRDLATRLNRMHCGYQPG